MAASGSVEMDFPVPEKIGTADKESGRDKARSGVFLRSGKGMVILGIGFVGVLAVTAVVAVQLSSPSTTQSDQSVPSAPLLLSETQPKTLVSPLDSLHDRVARKSSPADFCKIQSILEQHEKIAEEKRIREATQRRFKSRATLKSRKNAICTSPQCVASAERFKRYIDTSVDPCVNFYDFACGKWYQNNPVTNQSLGVFYTVDDKIQEDLLGILQSEPLPGDAAPLKDIRTHYKTCINTDTMDSLGLVPLWDQLEVQGGWPIAMEEWDENKFVMEEALVHIRKIGVSPIISSHINYDFMNTSHKILFVNGGDLGLPMNVLLAPNLYRNVITQYKNYIAESAKLMRDSLGSSVGDDAINADVNDLVNFEISLAKTMNVQGEGISDILTKTNVSVLQQDTDEKTPGQVDWLKYFHAMFLETDVVIKEDEPLYLSNAPYMTELSPLLFDTPARTIANYVGWRWTKAMASETTYAMRNLSFAFDHSVYGRTFPSRSNYCSAQTNSQLGFPLSRAYIDSYFSPRSKGEATELVALIRQAFMSLMNENTWMKPEDLVVAKEKLAAVVDHEAYPDWIMDNALLTLAYEGLKIKPEEQFDNLIRMADYRNFWDLETFRNHYTKTFIMPPTVVNAFYVPNLNDITILAGILQAPFFVLDSLAALNYGGIGLVIGHEFTHGFDNTGRNFDKDGNLAHWWSNETINAFNERSQCFKNQYDTYYPPELQGTEYATMHVNGQQTLGENIADNGGLREAFQAYMAYVEKYGEEARLPGLEEYSPNQLFFLGFANVWCEHKTTDGLVNQLENDPHSPGRFRVIGSTSNNQDFWETFNCPVDSPMNRGEERCQLW